jgi:hypothetical protein
VASHVWCASSRSRAVAKMFAGITQLQRIPNLTLGMETAGRVQMTRLH